MPASSGSGHLVVVEGIDGSGKTTVAKRLAERLTDEGHPVVETHEPTDTFRGEAVRRALADPDHDPVSEALLFAADHAAHVAELEDEIAEGKLVISDRYSTSWRVYQSITLTDAWPASAGPTPSEWLEALVQPFELAPDRVLVLDVAPDVALDRVDERPGKDEKFERRRFLERVREGYLDLVDGEVYLEVDASGTVDETVQACLENVHELLEEQA